MKTLLRLDLNVPIKNGTIKDTSKINSYTKSIKNLVKNNQLAVFSHIGRPKNNEQELSSKNLIPTLEKIWQVKVRFIADYSSEKITKALNTLDSNEIILLENTRFFDWEKSNDHSQAKQIASNFDQYILDAFASSHRCHLSTDAISDYLPSKLGDTCKQEVDNLTQAIHLQNPTIIMGGAKAQTKLMIIERFLEDSKEILVGGILANTFLKAQGFNIQKSIYEESLVKHCQTILQSKNSHKIILPFDFLVAESLESTDCRHTEILKPNEIILDIGPKTTQHFTQAISKNSNIIFNGPMGYIENPTFANGSIHTIQAICKQTNSYIGGGDSLKLMSLAKLNLKDFKFVSMGGGAMLEFIAEQGKLKPITKIKKSQ